MAADKAPFQSAIRESMRRLLDQGETLTRALIIENAVFADGRGVGATTLYAKNARTKEYVHKNLLEEINAAIDEQKKGAGKKTRSDTIAALKKDKAKLEKENKVLVDQVVTLESQLYRLSSGDERSERVELRLETEAYILSRLVNQIAPGRLALAIARVDKFELKHNGTEHLTAAMKEFERLAERLKDSTIVNFSDRVSIE